MAVQIKLSDLKNHVGGTGKVKLFCKILLDRSSDEFVIADQTGYKVLQANGSGNKHLRVGNFIKILSPEIDGNEIRIGDKTSIFATPEIKDIGMYFKET